MSKKLGVIAEDDSDIAVVKELTAKFVVGSNYTIKAFAGGGCGMLRRKCAAWAQNLIERGCHSIVIIHDLDKRSEHELRTELEGGLAFIPSSMRLILIPVHEIEAWLLYDGDAIKSVFSLPKAPKLPANPERIIEPKEYLRDLVWKCGRKRYVNNIHNPRIASALDLRTLAGCRSFLAYPPFLKSNGF